MSSALPPGHTPVKPAGFPVARRTDVGARMRDDNGVRVENDGIDSTFPRRLEGFDAV